MKNPIVSAMIQMATEVMMVVTRLNLFWKVLTEIPLKYQRLRKIDSSNNAISAVWGTNFRNGIFKNPKEKCPVTESGGVILMTNNERKKCFLA